MLSSSNRVTWHDDTLREMAAWAAKRYRLGRVEIIWREKIEKSEAGGGGISSGCTTFLEGSNGPLYIELLEGRTHTFLIQVLAHELAHCVAIKRRNYSGHGPVFLKIGNELVRAWNRRNEKRK